MKAKKKETEKSDKLVHTPKTALLLLLFNDTSHLAIFQRLHFHLSVCVSVCHCLAHPLPFFGWLEWGIEDLGHGHISGWHEG